MKTDQTGRTNAKLRNEITQTQIAASNSMSDPAPRHCERSEAIQPYAREFWIASSLCS
jgi:hypothetical protein